MKTSFRDWIREKIFDRIETLIASGFARMAETRLLKSQMQELNDLEDLAEEFEADGKSHLAQTLRQQASQIIEGAPAESANEIIRRLASDNEIIQNAMGVAAETESPKKITQAGGGARPKRRGRPPKNEQPDTESSAGAD